MVLHGAILCFFLSSLPPSCPPFSYPGSRSEHNSLGKDRQSEGRGEDGGGSSDLQIIYLRLPSA